MRRRSRGWTRRLLLLALAQGILHAQTLSEKAALVLDSLAARHGSWGIRVVDLGSGETVFERQPNHAFVPASTAKLFSAALALERLGSGHRFLTTVAAAQAPDASGRVEGDLILVGGGDPTLSGRSFPYNQDAPAGNPLHAVEDLADQVATKGVKSIEGNVVGDDTIYPWEPYAEGRAQEDALWEYGAPVSALSLNENRLTLAIRPGRRAGDPAELRLSPPLEYFIIENRVRTASGSAARVDVQRMPGSRQLRVWGVAPLKSAPVVRLLAVDDPAEFAATALYEALIRRGVRITGGPVARHRFVNEVPDRKPESQPGAPAGGVELARRLSPPLSEILEAAMKESLNLYAELALREAARVRRGVGSREAGIEELRAFTGEVGIPAGQCSLVDGSGLSMLDLVSPEAATRLLAYMNSSPNREAWLSLLPVAGREGTLRQRLNGTAAEGRIRAKTGSMSRVSALAGYAYTGSGRTLAFAIFANNYTCPPAEIRAVIDTISVLLVQ